MKVPSKLHEKVLSALQIAKLTGQIKYGLLEVMKSVETDKAKYLVIPTDNRPKNDKIKKKFATLLLLSKDNHIFCFEISTRKILGNIIGSETGTSCIAIIKPDRAESLFKAAAKEMEEETKI